MVYIISFDLVNGSISYCNYEPCLVNIIFDVVLYMGIILLPTLISPVQLSISSLRYNVCLKNYFRFFL